MAIRIYLMLLFWLYSQIIPCFSSLNVASKNSCSSRQQKFTTKSLQFGFQDTSSIVRIELIDLCYGLINGFKLSSHYDQVDQSVRITDHFIALFKQSLEKFGITIEKILGKGNYGSVFLANSKYYGKVAIKIASNQDLSFYDPISKRECCFRQQFSSGTPCEPCQQRLTQLIPFEVATAILTLDAPGVVKSRAYGVISTNGRLLFYMILMEYLENSMTLLSYVQKCFRQFGQRTRLKLISEIIRKLNEINKNLVGNFHVFHNDLKSDNILIKLEASEKCNSPTKISVFLIDFGNSILNVNQRDGMNRVVLSQNQFKYKKYYLMYRAPEITCQLQQVHMPQLLTWYLGVIAFEMCANGGGNIPVAPSPNVCKFIQSRHGRITNSFDSFIRPKYMGNNHFQMCFLRNMTGYLKKALSFDPISRTPSDELVKIKLF